MERAEEQQPAASRQDLSASSDGSGGGGNSPNQALNSRPHLEQVQNGPSKTGPGSSSGAGQQQQQQQQQQQPQQQPQKQATASTSFHLKTSIFTKRVTINNDKMALGLIKQLAVAFLSELYFQQPYPSGTPIGDYIRRHFNSNEHLNQLYDRLLLRKYNCNEETFSTFNSVSDIENESFISIEVSEKRLADKHSSALSNSGELAQGSPKIVALKLRHEFKSKSFLFITYCSSCELIIKGVIRQGFQCSSCARNYCSKCKVKAEQAGEPCLQLASSAAGASSAGSGAPGASLKSADSSAGASPKSPSSAGQSSQPALSMSKRKSASNLLHFNNPFDSSSRAAGHDEGRHSSRLRGSAAGALEPVLQQLSRMRDAESSTAPAAGAKGSGKSGNLLAAAQAAPAAHLSSSHQNLNAGLQEGLLMSAGQQPSACSESTRSAGHPAQQLSNSARTSVQDLVAASGGACSFLGGANAGAGAAAGSGQVGASKRDQNHSFIGMDWIQLSGSPDCGVCSKPLQSQGQRSQPPAMCTRCKLKVHVQCQSLVLADCLSLIAESSRAAAAERQNSPPFSSPAAHGRGRLLDSTNSNASKDNIRLHRLAPSVKHIKRPDLTCPIIEGWLKHTTLSDEQTRRHYWRLDNTDITLYESDTSTRYFKAIALNKITRVMSAQSLPKQVREGVLIPRGLAAPSGQDKSKSANSSPKKCPEFEAQMNSMFAFELTTGSMFLVQAGSQDEACRWRDILMDIMKKSRSPARDDAQKSTPSDQTKLGGRLSEQHVDEHGSPKRADTEAGRQAEGGTKKSDSSEPEVEPKLATQDRRPPVETAQVVAQQPPKEPQPQPQPAAQAGRRAYQPPSHAPTVAGFAPRAKTYTDPNRSRLYNRPRKTIKVNPMDVPDHYINGKYLIEQDPNKGFVELGSGQFGKVYAAISELKKEDPVKGLWSGVPVAIKEISKARFDLRQQAKLKNEANILSQLDHPGVIILERVHDLEDKIYIVMEQLEDDMLEMIVSTQEKRLNERVTKFLTYQILEALKYLHAKNIAHCDLKPENVLLVERRSQFPQIKLCDFGFAKIIEDNSFRSSLVGTPAYLAPEVVKGEKYNRSVDLWSVGVIVYVSLSGEFPFNEGENIHDQISRANFMYPDQPWAKISIQAKSFINSLLRVNCERRLSASRAQMDDWIQDFQLWCDLSELEVRVGKRWVTDDADFERWSKYARNHNLQIPRSAIQLHDELVAD